MCLKISQRNFRSGDLLLYITSRLIWYFWYVMQAKCWWPYLGHKINSQCNRVWHNTLPPYAASRWLCYLFIAIPTSQGMPTNMIEIFPFVTDRVDIMCSVHILSADTTQPSAVGALVYRFSWLNVEGNGNLHLWGTRIRWNTLRPSQNSRHFADDIFMCSLTRPQWVRLCCRCYCCWFSGNVRSQDTISNYLTIVL